MPPPPKTLPSGVLETLHVLGRKIPEDVQLITLSEESWNASTKYPGMLHTSRTAFTLGKKAAELLEENIKNPSLFEKKTCLLADQVPKIASAPPVHAAPVQTGSALSAKEGLRILMVDLATSHSTKLLSTSFTRETGIPIEFEFVRQSELLKRISQDVDRSENYFDIYMYDVPWLDYLIQNGFLLDITDFVQSGSFHSENVFAENLENCRHGQAYYGIPIIGGAQIMFYRQDLFENRDIAKAFKNQYQISLRPPKTWTEFNGIAQFFTRKYNPDSPTEFGTSLAGSMDEELAPELLIRLWSNGGKIWDKHFNVCLNTPENAKALPHDPGHAQLYSGSPFETDIRETGLRFCLRQNSNAGDIHGTSFWKSVPTSTKTPLAAWDTAPCPEALRLVSAGTSASIPLRPVQRRPSAISSGSAKTETSYYMTILNGQSPVIAPYHSHESIKLYPWLEYTEESFRYTRKRSMPYRSKSLCIPQNKIERILCSVLKISCRTTALWNRRGLCPDGNGASVEVLCGDPRPLFHLNNFFLS